MTYDSPLTGSVREIYQLALVEALRQRELKRLDYNFVTLWEVGGNIPHIKRERDHAEAMVQAIRHDLGLEQVDD